MKMINYPHESLIRSIVILFFLLNVSQSFSVPIKLYYDKVIPRIEFAAGDVQQSLAFNKQEIKHYSINDFKTVKDQFSIIIATKEQVSSLKSNHIKKLKLEKLTKSQSYLISTINSNGKTIWVVGADANGAMYGGLQLAEYIKLRGVEGEFNEQASPYIARRGIKLNIPLDARVPSYDDDGDAAHMNIQHMWDMEFWHNYFDILARNRYNVMSFWNCHPFNAMCKVPGYPETAVEDVHDYDGLVRRMTIDEKIQFWTEVFDYATNRGFEIFWFNWNVFAYGAVGKYGIEDNPRNEEVKAYSSAALKAFLKTYPQIDAFGVSAGEHFGGLDPVDREAWMADTWGKAMNDYKKENPESDFFFIHRYLMTGTDAIIKHFKDLPYHMDVSFKYVVGHMHGYVNPTLIYDVGVIDDIKKHNLKTWLNLRNDDMFYFRWNDPDYARQYIKNFPDKEKYIAGYYMGSDGYVFGKTFTFNQKYERLNNQMEFDKHWISFKMWGMLGYDPAISNDYFVDLISDKYPTLDAEKLFEVWQTASKIIPTVTSANWSRNDAQWYPEGCFYKKGYIDVEVFKNRSPQPGAPIYSIQEYKKVVLSKETPSKTTPIEIAKELRIYSSKVLDEIKPLVAGDNLALQSLILDLKGMAYLGLYYADKFEATVQYVLGDTEKTLMYLEGSLQNWKSYASTLSQQYIPQNLARMNMSGKNKTRNDCMFDWNEITKAIEKEIEMVKSK